MSITDNKEYEKIKKAILDRYGLNSWEYRENFRQCKQVNEETFREYTVRLKSYFEHWQDTESINKSYDALVDLMLREQLTFNASYNLQVWIREHQPASVEALVSLAEAYQLAHKESESRRPQFKFQNKPFGKFSFEQPSNENS